MIGTLARALLVVGLAAGTVRAEDTNVRLGVPDALEQSGFMQFLVPRFSLKTSIRIDRVSPAEAAQMQFGDEGTPVFVGLGQTWHLSHDGDTRAERFLDWLTSEIGQKTIQSFTAPDGVAFAVPQAEAEEEEEIVLTGDAIWGADLSLVKCGRCHVVDDRNRMKGMGASPSFSLMRAFEDWQTRFATFHLLKPHPAFTQVEGVSTAFDPTRPSPIHPVRLTLEELDAILAFVAGIEPADLGAPVRSQ